MPVGPGIVYNRMRSHSPGAAIPENDNGIEKGTPVRRLTAVAVSVLVCVLGSAAVVTGQEAPKTLHQAASAGDVEQLKQFIAKKANVNAVDNRGYTPLKHAVEAAQLEAVKVLLDAGAKPDVKDSYGMTPLHWVAMSDRADIAEALLAGKADHSIKDPAGRTALHCAVQSGQLAMVEVLVKGGADVNAAMTSGQTPLSLAQQGNVPEITDLLKKHGGALPAPTQYDVYGDYGSGSQGAPVVGVASQLPADFVIDPNVIVEQLKKLAVLEAPLKAVDANSESEQRAWTTRRSDNRTLLLRAVQKQFEEEMVFVKRLATEEKAAKTSKAVDDLVAARKKRYERIGGELREQRRQSMQEARDSMASARGRGNMTGTAATGRSGRGRSSGATGDPYATTSQMRTPRRAATEPNEPPIDADTQAQIDAWLNSQPEDKSELLKTSHELDVVEYAILHESAAEEQAAKTEVAIMALLMLRGERIAKIQQKWMEDDERMQRMQERMGPNGMQGMQPGMQQGTQQGMRRGRR